MQSSAHSVVWREGGRDGRTEQQFFEIFVSHMQSAPICEATPNTVCDWRLRPPAELTLGPGTGPHVVLSDGSPDKSTAQ